MSDIENKNGIYFSYGFLVLMIVAKAMGLDSSNALYYALAIVAGFFWIGHCLFQYFNKTQFFFSMGVMVIAVASTLSSRKLGFILTAMAIVCMRNLDEKTVLNRFFILWLMGTFILAILVMTGIIADTAGVDVRGQGIIRHTAGYGHPNIFHASYVILGALWLYKRKDKIKFIEAIVLILINTIVFYFSGSMTGVILGMTLPISMYVCRLFMGEERKQKILIALMTSFNIVLVIISFLCPLLMDAHEGYGRWYSTLLNRIAFSREVYHSYCITLFGIRDIEPFLDNAFVYELYQYGVLPFLFMVGSYAVTVIFLIKEKNIYKYMLITNFIFYGCFENFFNTAFMNFTWIIVGGIIMNEVLGDRGEQFTIWEKLKKAIGR